MPEMDTYLDDDGMADVGEQVIKMAEQLRDLEKVRPGGTAKWVFEMEDLTFELRLTIREAEGS